MYQTTIFRNDGTNYTPEDLIHVVNSFGYGKRKKKVYTYI